MPRKELSDPLLIGTYKVIGGNIFRRRGKMTQEELSKLADVSLGTIQAVESGLAISLENLIKVATALGCKPQDLFITDEDRKEITYAHVMLMNKITESLAGKKE